MLLWKFNFSAEIQRWCQVFVLISVFGLICKYKIVIPHYFKWYSIWMLFKTIEKSAAFELLFLKVSKVQLQKLTFLVKVNPTIFMSILWSFKNVFFKKFPVSWAHLSASSGKNWWPESAALTYSNIRYKNCYVCSRE